VAENASPSALANFLQQLSLVCRCERHFESSSGSQEKILLAAVSPQRETKIVRVWFRLNGQFMQHPLVMPGFFWIFSGSAVFFSAISIWTSSLCFTLLCLFSPASRSSAQVTHMVVSSFGFVSLVLRLKWSFVQSSFCFSVLHSTHHFCPGSEALVEEKAQFSLVMMFLEHEIIATLVFLKHSNATFLFEVAHETSSLPCLQQVFCHLGILPCTTLLVSCCALITPSQKDDFCFFKQSMLLVTFKAQSSRWRPFAPVSLPRGENVGSFQQGARSPPGCLHLQHCGSVKLCLQWKFFSSSFVNGHLSCGSCSFASAANESTDFLFPDMARC